MNELLEKFVHETLDVLGAERAELAEKCGVWRAELSDEAAQFLGRTQNGLLYTFDQERWEEGARLDCLTLHSPLVKRLQDLALAQGRVAQAHIQSDSLIAAYKPYLLALFQARSVSDQLTETTQWFGAQLESGEELAVRRDPFELPNLTEGMPLEAQGEADSDRIIELLGKMASRWNRMVESQSLARHKELDRQYREEVGQASAVLSGAELDKAAQRIAERLHLKVESTLQMVLILWIER